MTRIWSLVLAVLLTLSLTACGSSSGGEVKPPSEVSTPNAEVEESPQAGQAEDTEITIEETVLVDEAGVKITAKSLNDNGLLGAEVKLLIENSSGKDLTFQCRNSSVNGYMVETMMSVDVVDGKKANDSLIFMASDLENSGIVTIADMEFSFHIFTTADWKDYLDTPQIQLQTSAAGTYVYSFDDSGDLAYEGNGVKVVVKGLATEDSMLGPSVLVYLENNSDKTVTVQARDVSINGFMVDALFSSDVVTGKHAVDAITFLTTQLEENGISQIQTVELSFHIFDTASWKTIADTDALTLTF